MVKVYEGIGNLSSAIEAQEALLKKVMEYQDRDGEDKWQQLLDIELYHMDDLRIRSASEGRSLPKSSSSSSKPTSSSSAAAPAGAFSADPPGKEDRLKGNVTAEEQDAKFRESAPAVLFQAAPFE